MKKKVGCAGYGCLGVVFLFAAILGPFVSHDTVPSHTPQSSYSSAPQSSPTPDPHSTSKPHRSPKGSALAALNHLPVKAMDPDRGYDREGDFGTAWEDVNRNGCDTRNDILRRDFVRVTQSDGCLVYRGVLRDLYTGKTIQFTRGQTTSLAVQIDHLVSLHNAWLTGGQHISYGLRVSLANDPLNLEAVDGPTNTAKSDSDASWWLPPQRSARCEYVARQIAVKAAYHLWVTPDEKVSMRSVLNTCPNRKAYQTHYPQLLRQGLLAIH